MPEVRSLDAELPQRCVEVLTSGSDAPGRRIELAVRPYHLEITPRSGAVRLAGDEVAVTLAAKMM
jgi:hypothetical protein